MTEFGDPVRWLYTSCDMKSKLMTEFGETVRWLAEI